MTNVPIALVAKLRKAVPVSLLRAKEALSVNGGDLDLAIAWLEKEALANGISKASKVSDRIAAEGLIALTMDPMRRKGSLIEINCETDFVSRSPIFADLCTRLGNSHLFYENIDLNAPILPLSNESVTKDDRVISFQDAIISKVGELGEKIQLRRDALAKISRSKGIIGGYIHAYSGGTSPFLGRIGGIVSLNYDCEAMITPDQMKMLTGLADKIAQHVVGFNPENINPENESDHSNALMTQDFIMGGGTVENVLKTESSRLKLDRLWISKFYRMEVGEGIIKEESNFMEQVKQQAMKSSS